MQNTIARRQSWLTKFADDGLMFDIGGATSGVVVGSAVGAGFVGTLGLALVGVFAARPKAKACTLLAHGTGYKASDRDIYDSISAIRQTKI